MARPDPTATAAHIIEAIMAGDADDSITQISEALRMRQRAIRDSRALVNRAMLTPGARVALRGLSPKYLNGLKGTVEQDGVGVFTAKGGRIKVRLDDGQYTGKYSKIVNVPASALEAIE